MSENTTAVTGVLREFVDPDELRKAIVIDITDINGALQQQAQNYVYYATQAVRARSQWDKWKRALEVLEAKLSSKYRKELKGEDEKGKPTKPTEPQIKAAIADDPTWKSVSVKVIDAAEIARLCDVAVAGLEQRKDMVLQIARNAAKEMDGPLRVLHKQGAMSAKERLLSTMQANAAASKPVTPD